nr:ABC transporter ATP-binding protein [Candidatus Gracilibacteria bacterium]
GYEKILRFNYSFFARKKSGELMKMLDDGVEAYSNLGHVFFEQILLPCLSFVVLIIFAWTQSPALTIACLIVVPVHAAWQFYIARITAPFIKKNREAWHRLFGYVGDVFHNIITTKSFHQENREINRIKKLSAEAIGHTHRSIKIWVLSDLLEINTISQGVILFYGYLLIREGSITIGTMLLFLNILTRLLVPVQIIKANIRDIQANGEKFRRLMSVLKSTPVMPMSAEPHQQSTVVGKITFKKVFFSYNEERSVLKNFSLVCEPGEKVALVGHSGAGKSTIALLLMRFYDIDKGSIELDGVDLREWDYENLRSHFGVVWQENTLFHDTILNNIRYGSPHATMKQVITAAEQSYASGFIESLAKKYNSIVGERGVRLSGGEKQRVAIARALLKNPRIVILDEATSALDSITEREVQRGILNLIKERTAIIIAHRLSTVQHCDKIVVLDQGSVIAVGKHQELLKTCSQYQEMVSLQTHGFLASK